MKKRLLSLILTLAMLSSLLFSLPITTEAASTYDGNILKEKTKNITTSIPSLNET